MNLGVLGGNLQAGRPVRRVEVYNVTKFGFCFWLENNLIFHQKLYSSIGSTCWKVDDNVVCDVVH
jgi:hypothetical protein